MKEPDDSGPLPPGELLFSLDPEQSRLAQYRRGYKLNVVQIPAMRVIGFAGMTVAALLYDLNLPVFPAAGFATLAAINLGYAVTALVAIRALYDRVGRFDLTLLFLHLDVVMWLFTMHHVSAADQLFAFFLLVRVGDQVGFGFRQRHRPALRRHRSRTGDLHTVGRGHGRPHLGAQRRRDGGQLPLHGADRSGAGARHACGRDRLAV